MLQPKVQNFETHTIVEQYAYQVLDFSSQYGGDTSFSYTAANCLGLPSKFPKYGDFSSTFVMKKYGPWWNHEGCQSNKKSSEFKTGYDHFMDLKFEHSVYIYSVYVYETFNPGAVTAIFGGNCKGKWTKLWSGPTQLVGHQPRVFSPPINLSEYPINQLRLVFNQRHLPYFTEIDAVAILGTLEPPTTDAKLLAAVNGSDKGPILKAVIKQKLYRCLTETLTSFQDILQLNLLDIGLQCWNDRQERFQNSGLSDDGWFAKLPKEIILYVFGFLDFQSLARCSQVSALFRNISWDASLYSTVSLRPLFDKATNETFQYLNNRVESIVDLDLSWCGNYGKISPSVITRFLSLKCHTLVRLNVSNCHVFTNDAVKALSQSCPRLEDLNLANCHMLDQFFPLPSLKRLNVYRTQITTPDLRSILEQSDNLEYLNAGGCSHLDADVVCSTLAAHNKKLLSLDMWRSRTLTARGIFSLSYIQGLKVLDVGWCSNVDMSSGCLVALVSRCQGIEKLSLPAQRQLSDRDVAAIRENLAQSLQQLNIMGTRNISSEAIIHLADALTQIRLLDIGYCEQLESPEFLSLLRSKLPNCHIVSSFNSE